VAGLWLLVLAASRMREPAPLHVAVLCALAALASVTRGFGIHPFPLLGALCAYGLIVLGTERLRQGVAWTHSGLWGPGTLRLSLLTALLPLVGMPLWRLLAGPDVDQAVDYIAAIPVWILPAVGVFFALVNALVEEITFRGVLLDALWSAVGLRAALVLQAVAFGLVHIDGLPNGPWGAGLAGCYGLLLGLIRVRARGMVAPCVAHVLADLVIFGWLVAWAR
jgi:membrane protease YdiL (CAAX protease family)